MFKKKLLLVMALMVTLASCNTQNANQKQNDAPSTAVEEVSTEKQEPKEEVKEENKEEVKEESKVNLPKQNLMAVAWYQTSAEAKALYQQAYNVAKDSLDKLLAEKKDDESLAIALDLDETVLDNSPAQTYLAVHDKAYPEGWSEWIKYAKAEPVYGAYEFLEYANSKGVEIFYITNRKESEREDTKKNLECAKIPLKDDDHLLLKEEGMKDKISRMEKIEENHKLVMLFGDNLLDFGKPEEDSLESREKFVKDHASEFGYKYIAFPNPMYGSWEGTLYQNDWKKSDEEKQEDRMKKLKIFNPEKMEVEAYTKSE